LFFVTSGFKVIRLRAAQTTANVLTRKKVAKKITFTSEMGVLIAPVAPEQKPRDVSNKKRLQI